MQCVTLVFFASVAMVGDGMKVPDMPEPVTSCAATSCMAGSECWVVNSKNTGIIRPSCENPDHVPRTARRKRFCGYSGRPMLKLLKETRGKRRLRIYRNTSCPAPGLVFVKKTTSGVCCFRTEKPGLCPKPADVGICIVECIADNSCRGIMKCCPTGCSGSTSCRDPLPKEGECPALRCLAPVGTACNVRSPCTSDWDCQGNHKCCPGCDGCTACTPVSPPPSCSHVKCELGQECVLLHVHCVTTPCPPLPTCVDKKNGSCPKFGCPVWADPPDCPGQCTADAACEGDLKCCWGCDNCHSCMEPLSPPSPPPPPLTCANVLCKPGHDCVMEEVQCVTSPCIAQPTCKDICLLPPKSGTCKAKIPKFYFDATSGQCKTFDYGGCDGNGNRFESLEDCEITCLHRMNCANVRCPIRCEDTPDGPVCVDASQTVNA